MATSEDLQEWVVEALRALGGKARIVVSGEEKGDRLLFN